MSNIYIEQNYSAQMNLCRSTISDSNSKEKGLQRLVSTLSIWRARSAQRKQLAHLDKHLLKDIGLTAEMAILESKKPFWR